MRAPILLPPGYGWWQVWRARRTGADAEPLLAWASSAAVVLRLFSGAVSDLGVGRPVDRVDVGIPVLLAAAFVGLALFTLLTKRRAG